MRTTAEHVEELVRRGAGQDFEVQRGDSWVVVRPDGADLAESGWKLHVSSRVATYPSLLETVVPLLLDAKVMFKVAASDEFLEDLNAGTDYPAGVGKAVAVYPDEDRVAEIGLALARALRGHEGPKVLSDRRVAPGSPVYYRYGQFVSRPPVRDDGGKVVGSLRGPDGQVFDADAILSYRQPGWLADPFTGEQAPDPSAAAAGSGGLLGDRFRITSGIRESPSGNVYRGIDERTGERVVVKQARPFVAEHEGFDARMRLRNERRILERLAGIDAVPVLFDHFLQSDDEYLACSDGGSTNLNDAVGNDGPFPLDGPGPRTVTALATRLADALVAFHARGVVMRDLTPANILFGTGGVRIVDFGLSDADGVHPAGGTPGYMPARQARNDTPETSDDLHALAMVLLFAATGVHPVAFGLHADSPRRRALETVATRYGTHPVSVMAQVVRLLDTDPDVAGAALLALSSAPAPAPLPPVYLPAPHRFSPDDAARLVSLLRDGLLFETDRLVADLAATIEGHDVNVHGGLPGIGFELLHHLDVPGVAERVRHIVSAAEPAAKKIDLAPGLLSGFTGVQVFHAAVAAAGLVSEHLPPPPTADTSGVTGIDLTSGAAGVALGYLEMHRHAPDGPHFEAARQALRPIVSTSPARLVEQMSGDGDLPFGVRPGVGVAHGLAGVVLALLAYDDASETPAGSATEDCLGLLVELAPDLVDVAADPRAVALSLSWCQGLAGVGGVLLRAGLQRRDHTLVDLATTVADRCMASLPRVATVGQCCGISGIGTFMLNLAEAGRPGYRDAAFDVASHLMLRTGGEDERPVFVERSSDGRAASWARGTSGILGFLRRLDSGGSDTLAMLTGPRPSGR